MKRLLFILLLSVSPICMAQEDCSNGIDDDNDQLIDLNDDDCTCEGLNISSSAPESLIPNPSFEEYTCLPTYLSQLNCADDWIQASDATSDYFHTDGYMPANINIPAAPLPIPEGNAFVGVINDSNPNASLNYKEYIGACLVSDLPANTSITIQFYVGFSGSTNTTFISPPQVDICLFGSTDCSNLPFSASTCPSDYSSEWIELACTTVSGNNEWIQTSLTYTFDQNISTIILGPSCPVLNPYERYYYFIDDLVVNESALFESNLSINSEIDCNGILDLNLNITNTVTYQWYYEGVAISGETNSNLSLTNPTPGMYQVLIDDGTNCQVSDLMIEPQDLEIPTLTVTTQNPDCILNSSQITVNGNFDSFLIDGNPLSSNTVEIDAGTYLIEGIYGNGCSVSETVTIVNTQQGTTSFINSEINCDGILNLNLSTNTNATYQWYHNDVALIGETNPNLNINATIGTYQVVINDGTNCQVNQVVVENEDFNLPELTITIENPTCNLDNGEIAINGNFDNFLIDGNSTSSNTINLAEGTYFVEGIYGNGCSVSETITLVNLNIEIEVTPDTLNITTGETAFSSILDDLNSNYTYAWSPTQGLSCTDCKKPAISPSTTTTYTVAITDTNNGCSTETNITVFVKEPCKVFTPTAFSPNNDGKNDHFTILSNQDCFPEYMSLKIFNRWGNIIVDKQNITKNENIWDGTINGQPAPIGVYLFVFQYTTEQAETITQNGNITLIR